MTVCASNTQKPKKMEATYAFDFGRNRCEDFASCGCYGGSVLVPHLLGCNLLKKAAASGVRCQGSSGDRTRIQVWEIHLFFLDGGAVRRAFPGK